MVNIEKAKPVNNKFRKRNSKEIPGNNVVKSYAWQNSHSKNRFLHANVSPLSGLGLE